MLSDERMDVVDRLSAYAKDHGHTLPELALSYLASTPTVASVIAGATSPEQVKANAAATSAWVLTDAERAEAAELANVGS